VLLKLSLESGFGELLDERGENTVFAIEVWPDRRTFRAASKSKVWDMVSSPFFLV